MCSRAPEVSASCLSLQPAKQIKQKLNILITIHLAGTVTLFHPGKAFLRILLPALLTDVNPDSVPENRKIKSSSIHRYFLARDRDLLTAENDF